uniref:Uncharacterized protein n=1 Tax=Strigamia maritima TaxID=126957 RepID=T1J038_STRMM
MASAVRKFSTSCVYNGKKNFRKFYLFNRGPEDYKKERALDPFRETVMGVRLPGINVNEENKLIPIPEMIPELIVPDFKRLQTKTIRFLSSSRRNPIGIHSQTTLRRLLHGKMISDFKNGKLDENGDSKEPNEDEKRTAEEAWIKARQTGSDIYCREAGFKKKPEPFM